MPVAPTSLVTLSKLCAHLKNCMNVSLSKTAVPYNRTNLQVAIQLYNQGFISGIQKGSNTGPDLIPTDATPNNINTRRIWLDLKYRNNLPVITNLEMISKPSKKIELSTEDVRNLASGLKVRRIDQLQPAECIFIEHENELYEINEAAKKGLSGKALFRVR
ncbi:uncharacterized protein KGF55_004906 [Candida pseudojiufengensis]|uniref:uncharacterized protein n=1 Tax=Candida pseudojiufengensis TaxID=497109 RepID=UPI002225B28C|nr:uncharacterized protein KGF55_004906 [Candida pseudojiufengensis]KAI5960183.1 hypothetical protein KGF55_004906 [Candida pseudojiufengensis]